MLAEVDGFATRESGGCSGAVAAASHRPGPRPRPVSAWGWTAGAGTSPAAFEPVGVVLGLPGVDRLARHAIPNGDFTHWRAAEHFKNSAVSLLYQPPWSLFGIFPHRHNVKDQAADRDRQECPETAVKPLLRLFCGLCLEATHSHADAPARARPTHLARYHRAALSRPTCGTAPASARGRLAAEQDTSCQIGCSTSLSSRR